MSKHPRYLAVEKARIEQVPIAFNKYSTVKFILKQIQAEKQEDGRLPWPHYIIYDKKDNEIAIFYADGKSECYAKSFRKIHQKMVEHIERVAAEVFREVEKMEIREIAEIHGFDPTFYDKEKEFTETQKKEY